MTNMDPSLPGPSCNEYVSGGYASYPCKLPSGHDGPHVAIEVPASARARQLWMTAQRAQQPAPAASSTPSFDSPPVPLPFLAAERLIDPAEREEQALAKLRGAVGSFPRWAREGMIAASAEVSLALLWSFAQAEFATGAQAVILSREFLERLVTPSLRDFLNNFVYQQE